MSAKLQASGLAANCVAIPNDDVRRAGSDFLLAPGAAITLRRIRDLAHGPLAVVGRFEMEATAGSVFVERPVVGVIGPTARTT